MSLLLHSLSVLKVCIETWVEAVGFLSHSHTFSLSLSLSCLISLGGVDFEQISRTFSFPTGNDTACTAIAVVDDRVALEGEEQFTVELTLPPGEPAGLLLGTNSQTTITITDNDGRNSTLYNQQLAICYSVSLFSFPLLLQW